MNVQIHTMLVFFFLMINHAAAQAPPGGGGGSGCNPGGTGPELEAWLLGESVTSWNGSIGYSLIRSVRIKPPERPAFHIYQNPAIEQRPDYRSTDKKN
ncbi:MAG: hypothetical protein AAFZ15_16395 [Bacteroidota bacterium]